MFIRATISIAATIAATICAIVITGCADAPVPTEAKSDAPKKPAIPTGAIPALTAYYETYKAARQISPDVQAASIVGNEVDGVKSEDGKYAQWTVVFTSALKQQATTFVYTTVEHDRLLKGINNTGSMKWTGPTQDAVPFANSDFSIDSDAAYKAAAAKAATWLGKNPGKPVTTFALGQSARLPTPTWYIMWGDKKNGFAAYVNAATGEVK
jgi:hypothetical protein